MLLIAPLDCAGLATAVGLSAGLWWHFEADWEGWQRRCLGDLAMGTESDGAALDLPALGLECNMEGFTLLHQLLRFRGCALRVDCDTRPRPLRLPRPDRVRVLGSCVRGETGAIAARARRSFPAFRADGCAGRASRPRARW